MRKKTIVWLSAILCMMACGKAFAQENENGKVVKIIEISVGETYQSGVLREKLGDEIYEIDSLVILGRFNLDKECDSWKALRESCQKGRLRGIDLSGCYLPSIPDYAFAPAPFEESVPIHYITLPKECRTIRKYAFSGSELKGINLSDVKEIQEGAFAGCNLKGEPNLESALALGDYCFEGCNFSGTIEIPEGVKKIGKGAFAWNTHIEKVMLPSSLEMIDDEAFLHCYRLRQVEIPEGLLYISNRAFFACPIEGLDLPQSVEYIGEGAFGALNTWTLKIPDNIMEIYANEFYGNEELREIVWPSHLLKIGPGAFCFNGRIGSITIPDEVNNIDSLAFFFCTGLLRVVLPANLQHLGLGAFASCMKLHQVVARCAVPPFTESPRVFGSKGGGRQVSPFDNIPEDAILYVPKGAKEAYEQAEYWKDFKTIIELDEGYDLDDLPVATAIKQVNTDVHAEPLRPIQEGVYTLHGVKLNGNYESLPRGTYIINGRKVVK